MGWNKSTTTKQNITILSIPAMTHQQAIEALTYQLQDKSTYTPEQLSIAFETLLKLTEEYLVLAEAN